MRSAVGAPRGAKRQSGSILTTSASSQALYRSQWFFKEKLLLTHAAAPPSRKKSRSARLFACKRAHDGLLSLPTFCGWVIRSSCFLQLPGRIELRRLLFTFCSLPEKKQRRGVFARSSAVFVYDPRAAAGRYPGRAVIPPRLPASRPILWCRSRCRPAGSARAPSSRRFPDRR